MTHLKASVLVDGKEEVIYDGWFQCRDELIPRIRYELWRKYELGHELEVNRDLTVELRTVNPRVIDWDDILGINATSPMASPFLLRFYIGRVRSGYQYQKLEDALRRASNEGVRLPDMVTAWRLDAERFDNSGLGLSAILPTVRRNGWNYSEVDHATIFPPSRFI